MIIICFDDNRGVGASEYTEQRDAVNVLPPFADTTSCETTGAKYEGIRTDLGVARGRACRYLPMRRLVCVCVLILPTSV